MGTGIKSSQVVAGTGQVATICPEASLQAAVRQMKELAVGSLVVVDESGVLKGIISERDVITRGLGMDNGLEEITVGQAMTRDVVCCEVGTPLEDIQRIMTENRIRHLPVVKDGVLTAMESARDVMARQIERDRSMRMAAEQAATLSSSLQSLDLEDVVKMVIERVPAIFGARRCLLYLPGGNDTPCPTLIERHQCKCSGQNLPSQDGQSPESPETVCQVDAACQDVGGDGRRVILQLHGATHEDDQARNLMGVLCICHVDASMSADILEYKAALVRSILESNLASAFRHAELKRTASIDPLTGVGTRMPFDRRLEEECDRAARYDSPFCLAMIDVDHFKSMNDHLGHAGGDRALAMVAACMDRNKRNSDVLARYGGDEFVMLLPETEIEGGFLVLERLRKLIAGMIVAEGVSVTISCGVVDSRSCTNANANELLRRADMALYRAKETGRDCTESWAGMATDPTAIGEEEGQEVVELRDKLADISTQVKETFIQSIGGLVRALDARDPYTKRHSENTMRYAVSIAENLRLPEDEVAVIRRAAVIHDLGKIGVRDSILLRPGQLTEEELRTMHQHPVIAGRILEQMRFLERELPIVRHHHERWDGHGYPDGLAGIAIPFGARILAVADSFDAITSTRVYRDARGVDEALGILAENAGTQFDRTVVDAMLRWADDIHRRIGRNKPMLPTDLLDTQSECVLAV